MIRKNLICGILVLSTILTVLTGCGSKASDGGSKNTAARESYTNTVVVSKATTYPVEKYTETEPAMYDYGLVAAEAEYSTTPYYAGEFNTEKYNSINESSFLSAVTTPLSTFAADVDTASYSNFRRMVEWGYGINSFPSGSLRTEEMLNYFDYDYKAPKKGETFGVNANVSRCPWNEDAKLLTLGINTASMDKEEMPDCNIVFLIDVSGSMCDYNKLPLIKEAMGYAIEQFDENDRISIVTYASGVNTVLDGAKGNRKDRILRAFNDLSASGSTNGGDGIKLAYEVAERNFIDDGVNRVIICSDGDFNVGLTSQSELEDLISEKKDTGIFLSVLGFGMYNYSDTTMETLADCGNGNYAYIDEISEAKKVLVDEMTSTFVTIAKDVKFQVEFNPYVVKNYRIVGYENRAMAAEDFKDDTKDGGEIGAGHQVTVMYELILNDKEGTDSGLKYQKSELTEEGEYGDEYCTVSIAYKEPDGEKSMYVEYPIGVDCLTDKPDDDFVFASMVAMTSLALRDSEYLKAYNPTEAVTEALNVLNSRNYEDEYKSEFIDLLKECLRNSL